MNELQNEEIRAWLEEHAEEKLLGFSSSLIPGAENVLGVRIPILRDYAKKLAAGDWRHYLEHAADTSMEEIHKLKYYAGFNQDKVLEQIQEAMKKPIIYNNELMKIALAVSCGSFKEKYGLSFGAEWQVSFTKA